MTLRSILALGFASLATLCLAVACSTSYVQTESAPRTVTVPPPAPNAETPVDLPGIHNVVAYGTGIYSGSVPEGGEGFETLASMGMRTVISVDGAAPDADEAAKHGLRYVHFPVTYGGISEERQLEITRAVRDLPGPVYIHCHHGKHRSAAASAAASVALGRLDNAQATARMKVSGTAPNYEGLYACASDSRRLSDSEISAAPDDFPSKWRTTGMVDAMVAIDEANDQLKAIEKARWGVPADHPDLIPSAVAGNLENLLRGLEKDHDSISKPQEFRELLKASADAAQKLEDGLVNEQSGEELAKLMKSVADSCKACHTKYRD